MSPINLEFSLVRISDPPKQGGGLLLEIGLITFAPVVKTLGIGTLARPATIGHRITKVDPLLVMALSAMTIF